MSFLDRLKARLARNKQNAASSDRVSELVQETKQKLDRTLRGLQTRLHLQARWKYKMRHVADLAAQEALKAFRERPRVHFGEAPAASDDLVRRHAPTRFENSIVDTFSDHEGTGLYFRFQSGQIVNADRVLRPGTKKRPRHGRNPVIRELVVREVNLNATRK